MAKVSTRRNEALGDVNALVGAAQAGDVGAAYEAVEKIYAALGDSRTTLSASSFKKQFAEIAEILSRPENLSRKSAQVYAMILHLDHNAFNELTGQTDRHIPHLDELLKPRQPDAGNLGESFSGIAPVALTDMVFLSLIVMNTIDRWSTTEKLSESKIKEVAEYFLQGALTAKTDVTQITPQQAELSQAGVAAYCDMVRELFSEGYTGYIDGESLAKAAVATLKDAEYQRAGGNVAQNSDDIYAEFAEFAAMMQSGAQGLRMSCGAQAFNDGVQEDIQRVCTPFVEAVKAYVESLPEGPARTRMETAIHSPCQKIEETWSKPLSGFDALTLNSD